MAARSCQSDHLIQTWMDLLPRNIERPRNLHDLRNHSVGSVLVFESEAQPDRYSHQIVLPSVGHFMTACTCFSDLYSTSLRLASVEDMVQLSSGSSGLSGACYGRQDLCGGSFQVRIHQ